MAASTTNNRTANASDGWVSVEEVAKYWSISTKTAQRRIREQGIEQRKLGRLVRVRRTEMENMGKVIFNPNSRSKHHA